MQDEGNMAQTDWLKNSVQKDIKRAENSKIFINKLEALASASSKWGRMEKANTEDMVKKGFDDNIHKDISVQDFSKQPIMLGSDVSALYPSMGIVQTAELAEEAVLN